ncbi:MAG: aminotransferase class V-fold PLP-dependent enzyme [Acidimicrobiia bacterium]|nr:aminotransferase class V-fold PLP-dependent enzyme [Acidimicrobiia bacterium]
MRALGGAVLDLVADFIAERTTAPAQELDHPLPDHPTTPGNVADVLDFVAHAARRAVDPAGPGYLAFIPGGGLYTAALADFITAGVNRYTTVAALAPAFVELEAEVIRWIADLFAFPFTAQGILTTGGSLANFSAIVTARYACLGEEFAAEQPTIYVSDQAHHSITKAAALAGFSPEAICVIPTGADLRMDLDALERAITRDPHPFLIVGSAGTTNTGAIDPLDDLATIAGDHGLWLHVDAAYGGFFQLTERGRHKLRGVERADSITLDPHKGMFLPYGSGCLIVRDGALLKNAHTADAEYLQDLPDVGLPNYAEYSPELSRAFRGLRIWLPLQLHGVEAFSTALDEKLGLARHAYDRLQQSGDFELPWEPELSVVAFHHPEVPRILDEVNSSKRVFLSSTTIRDRHTLRIAILSHRTHRDRVDEAVDLLEKAARQ